MDFSLGSKFHDFTIYKTMPYKLLIKQTEKIIVFINGNVPKFSITSISPKWFPKFKWNWWFYTSSLNEKITDDKWLI